MPYQGRLPYTYKSPYNYTLDQGTQTVPSLAFLGDTNNGLFSPATDVVAITTNGSEKLRVTSDGRVGIGITNPVGTLEVRDSKANLIVAKDGLTVKSNSDLHTSYDTLQIGAGGALLSYSVETVTADTQFVHNAYRSSGGTFKYRYTDSAARIRMNSPQGAIIFDNAASGSADADITFSERFRISSTGNVGIGTTDPTSILDVRSSASDSSISIGRPSLTPTISLANNGGQNSGRIIVRHDNAAVIEFRADGNGSYINTGNFGIGTNNPTEKLTIYEGKILVGASPESNTTGEYELFRGFTYLTAGVQYGAVSLKTSYNNTTNTSSLNFYVSSGGTNQGVERMRLTGGGNVGIGTTNPGFNLDVYPSSGSAGVRAYAPTSNAGFFEAAGSNNTVRARLQSSGTDAWVGTITNHEFWIATNNDRKVTVAASGNIGIGTTNPSEKLEVTGKVRIFDGGYPYIDIGITTSNYFRIIHDNPNDRLFIGKNNNASLVITGGNNVEPGADATQNLGSSTKRWANIYSADLQLSNEGSQNDVDGTWGQYTIQEGENDLFLLNRRNGKKYKFVLQEVN